jgi:hypothetical protein
MFSRAELEQMQEVNINTVEIGKLVDISEIDIDSEAPIIERLERFFADVKNPYCFRYGNIPIKIQYTSQKTLKQCLSNYFIAQK